MMQLKNYIHSWDVTHLYEFYEKYKGDYENERGF